MNAIRSHRIPARRLLLAMGLTLIVLGPAFAQDAPATQPPRPEARANTEHNVRVDVTISIKAAAKPIIKHLSLVTVDSRPASGRAGIDIPLPSPVVQPMPTYRSVGVNVDATPQVLASGKVSVRLKLNFSTVFLAVGEDAAQTTAPKNPSFGNGSIDLSLVLTSGTPLVVTQAMDGESGRDYTVEVKATVLK